MLRIPSLKGLSPAKALCLCLGAAFLLCLPGLQLGLLADDYMHIAVIDRLMPVGGPLDLFDWAPGNAEVMQPRIFHGPYPWTTNPDVRVVFCRPLSSALITLDHTLFKHLVPLQHLHSMLWYGLAVIACHLLFRRFLPGAVAFLAVFLFAIDDSHLFAALWLANRNALVAAVPVLFGLCAHVQWREDGWRPGLPLSLLCYAVGLMGGETALGALAYLAAYEAFAAPGKRLRRVTAVLPATVMVLAYLAVYKTLGYGASGSAFYVDPIGEPWIYLSGLPSRLLTLTASQLVGFPADLWLAHAAARVAGTVAGLAGIALLGVLLKKHWPQITPRERRLLSWMVPGALLSMLPLAATLPTSRLLLVPSVGVSTLLAVVLHAWWQARKTALLARWRAVSCWFLVAVHLFQPFILWPATAAVFSVMGRNTEHNALCAETDRSVAGANRFVMLVAPDLLVNVYTPIMRTVAKGVPMPDGWLAVSPAPYPHRIRRTAANELEMEVLGGNIGNQLVDALFNNGSHAFHVGDRVETAGATITVLETDATGVTKVKLTFDRPLEDPMLRFLSAKNGYLERMEMPALGEEMIIPAQKSLLSVIKRP